MKKSELVEFEDKIKEHFLNKNIRSPIHLSGYGEDRLIEIFKDVKPNDWVFSTHRNHYHALLKGIPSKTLEKDILAGESMHIFSKEHKFFTSSIVGGILPIAVGVAMALKRKKSKDKVWVFIGDMAATMGVYHECLKYATGYDLPIKFVIEDNGYSVDSRTSDTWGKLSECPMTREEKQISYKYRRKYPHVGVGRFNVF
jgi:pyruvate dehydrogenase E1 component alpha subunit